MVEFETEWREFEDEGQCYWQFIFDGNVFCTIGKYYSHDKNKKWFLDNCGIFNCLCDMHVFSQAGFTIDAIKRNVEIVFSDWMNGKYFICDTGELETTKGDD